ncbi:transcription factor bHLH18-like isoform X1 [Zingiber officinale]|uniref:transcription factor bHLH18-like isoform X1 n=1 Tax=Zingiber officinale TaxID=94328 RepID=UPI001C4AF8CF|nr:transcription factor bHLH18-like isoform X1 [Zingiber officinale]
MEALASSLYCDMDLQGMDHSQFDQWELTALDHEFNAAQHLESWPQKTAKTRSWSSSTSTTTTTKLNSAPLPDAAASGPMILSFASPDLTFYGDLAPELNEEMEVLVATGDLKRSFDTMLGQGPKRGRTASHNQEHILAERKRREKLSQRFVALSAIVPGLKKMDKASVLGDAIKYLKQLQEKVQSLEDQIAKRSIESAVLVKKSHLCNYGDSSSGNENSNESHGESLPQIEARVCAKSILIKIHCENHKGALVRAISEIEKLHLSVTTTSVMAFTRASLDITVMAQMDEEFSMTVKDLVKQLSSACRQLK